MSRLRPLRIVAPLALALVAGAGAQMVPLDPAEWQVNTQTIGDQRAADVAVGPGGGFVVVWQSPVSAGTDDDGTSVQARRFDRFGVPRGPDFQVNVRTAGAQTEPKVAARPGGGFVVAWTSDFSPGDPDETSIQVRRYAADGSPLDPVERQVNVGTSGRQIWPEVAVDADGGFVVTWADVNFTAGDGNRGRRFAANGVPLGGDFPVSADAADHALALRPSGEFVVAWVGGCVLRDGCYSVFARRFDADGAPLDPARFLVNTGGDDSYVEHADVAVGDDGGFVVAWDSERYLPGSGYANIWARRFAWDTTPLDAEPLFVNSQLDREERRPRLALDEAGNFLVAWQERESFSGSAAIAARRFHADGTAQDPGGFPISTRTGGSPSAAAVSLHRSGRLVAAWQDWDSAGSDTSGDSVQARRFLGLPFFSDGFEAGDAGRWSAVVP